MEEIKIGSHVGMAGKEMFLASVKEAERYGANVLMLYTGAPQNTRRKEIKDLNIEAGWEYATKAGIREIVVHAPYIINLSRRHLSLLWNFWKKRSGARLPCAVKFWYCIRDLH